MGQEIIFFLDKINPRNFRKTKTKCYYVTNIKKKEAMNENKSNKSMNDEMKSDKFDRVKKNQTKLQIQQTI